LVNHLKAKHPKEWNAAPSGQSAITEFFKKPAARPQSIDLDRALVDMVTDGLPLRIVEQPGFRKFVSLSAPEYDLPSRRTLVRRINAEYDDRFHELRERLHRHNTFFSITSDLWASRRQHSFLSVTLFYIYESDIYHYNLCTKLVSGSHTGELISSEIHSTLCDFSIESRLYHATTDNAANIRKACRLLNVSQSGCTAHLLHLVVINGCGLWTKRDITNEPRCSSSLAELSGEESDEHEEEDGAVAIADGEEFEDEFSPKSVQHSIYETVSKARRVVNLFRRSNKAMEIFREKCTSTKGLQNDVQTRWNSTVIMCESILENKETILYVLNDERMSSCLDHRGHDIIFSPTDWRNMTMLVEVLGLFHDCTKDLSGSNYPTLCRVYVMRRLIKDHLAVKSSDNEQKRLMKTQLSLQFTKYFDNDDYQNQDLILAATFLDPRTKAVLFTAAEKRSAENLIKDLSQKMFSQNPTAEVIEVPMSHVSSEETRCSSPHPIDAFIQRKQTEAKKSVHLHVNTPSIRNELSLYLEMPLENTDENMVQWWFSRKHSLPTLHKVASVIHAIPATSVASESAFSQAGSLLRRERVHLSPKLLNKLMFLRNFSHAVDAE
jgi:hypothetical protein